MSIRHRPPILSLCAHQEDVAARFAGRGGIKGPERYEGSVWQVNATGVSVLADALATFDCEVEDLLERHSHVIVIGRVRSVVRPGGSGALLYWRGEFDQIGWTYEQVNRACGVQPIR